MKRILGILKELGVEVPEEKQEELTKTLTEKYKAVEEYDKALKKVETERDSFETKFKEASDALSNIDTSSLEKAESERDAWKQKAEKYEAEEQQKTFVSAFEKGLSEKGYEFSSDLAKKAAIQDAKSFGVEFKNGNLVGMADFLSDLEKNYPKDLLKTEEVLKQKELEENAPKVQVGAPINNTTGKSALGMNIKPLSKMSVTEATELKRTDPQAYDAAKGMD